MSKVCLSMSKTELGNTRPTPKRISVSKYWCFTFNNYKKQDLSKCLLMFKSKTLAGIIGEEVGEKGTPHLQGYIECKKGIRPLEYFDLPKTIHWEKRKGSRDDNITYCSKEGKVHSWGFPEKYDGSDTLMVKNNPNKLQKEVFKLLEREHDDREIHYFVGDGGDGKTKLCKYLIHFHKATFVGGASQDVFFGLPDNPRIVLWNLQKHAKISKIALESVKDGLCYSTKYESGCKIFKPPIVLVFGNNYILDNNGEIDTLNNRIIYYDYRKKEENDSDCEEIVKKINFIVN